jgi:hypothetical protein
VVAHDGADQVAAGDCLVTGFPRNRVFGIPVHDAMRAGHEVLTFLSVSGGRFAAPGRGAARLSPNSCE